MVASKIKPICHIHDEAEGYDDDEIRANVCVNDEPFTKHSDGNYYCLFHLPSENKDVEKFEQIFRERLGAVEIKLLAITELPEQKQEDAKNEITYDFNFVWFPSVVDLCGYTFSADVYFNSATFLWGVDFDAATFSGATYFRSAKFSADALFHFTIFSAEAYFGSTTFSADAFFESTQFSADADFRLATFLDRADFILTTFMANAVFSSVTFSADAEFYKATFSALAQFTDATFSAGANFSSATFAGVAYFINVTFSGDARFFQVTFSETSQVFFLQTKFCKTVCFYYSVFAGYIAFEGKVDEKVFLDKEGVSEVKKELKGKFEKLQTKLAERGINFQIPDNFVENQEAVLDLQNARLEKPERISFHRVHLCPSWFVNVDSRKMVFTDVRWDNLDSKFRNRNIEIEIESLEKRKVRKPRRLLEIACRQLGVNAEENNRYEDASKFRYMAMETRRLEYAWQGRLWSLSWWYRLLSGYGENWSRALCVLVGILLLFSLLYATPFSSFDYGEKNAERTADEVENQVFCCANYGERFHHMEITEAMVHSGLVAAFQRPEPKPANTLTKFFVFLETIFAPLQAALLALAIRRKFMR